MQDLTQLSTEELKKLAKETISAENYYDFCNAVDDGSYDSPQFRKDLIGVINCGGDYEKEIELWESQR